MGETLKFPATTEEVQALLKRIGVDGVRYPYDAFECSTEAYRERCETNRYIAYSREAKRRGEVPVDRETWETSTCHNDSLPVVTNCHQQNDNSKPKSALTETEIEKGEMGGMGERKLPGIRCLEEYCHCKVTKL